jgi:hypothetical protein
MTLFLSWFSINSIKFISVFPSTLIYSFPYQFPMPIQCYFLIAVTFISIFISHHFHSYFRVISTFCWAVNLATECSSVTAALNVLLQSCPSVLLVTAGTRPALFHSVNSSPSRWVRGVAPGRIVVLYCAAPVPHRRIPHRARPSIPRLLRGTIKIREESILPRLGDARRRILGGRRRRGTSQHVVVRRRRHDDTRWVLFTRRTHAVDRPCKLKYFSSKEVTGQDCSEQAMARAAEKAIDPQLLLMGSILLTGLIVGFFC